MQERFGLSRRRRLRSSNCAAAADRARADKIEAEYQETLQSSRDCARSWPATQMVTEIIKEELIALRDKYGDPRRTKIVDATGEFESRT